MPFGSLKHPLYYWYYPDWMNPDELDFRWDEEEKIVVNDENLHWVEE